jgi:hypothetical protein
VISLDWIVRLIYIISVLIKHVHGYLSDTHIAVVWVCAPVCVCMCLFKQYEANACMHDQYECNWYNRHLYELEFTFPFKVPSIPLLFI